jgi:hypothetical protein
MGFGNMEEVIKYKVIYLMMNGWNDFTAIQKHLNIPDEDMGEIMQWLIKEQYINTYTIH